ncbi:MAG TPA: ATPase, T2SS/T4P/T4SS family [Candidatus Margulisiibacteriota bacterium]|nr:ATPase, T2SS/T4P/T4SS family [Candidatus Margulisiibacteriota bacterium]
MAKQIDTLLSQGLIEKGLLEKRVTEELLAEAAHGEITLQQVLLERRILPESQILNVLAEKLGLSYVNLKDLDIEKQVLTKVPVKIATYYKFLPIKIKGRLLTIAVSHPFDIKTQDEIRTQLGYDIEIALSLSSEIADGLKKYYGLGADTLDEIFSQQAKVQAPLTQENSYEKVEDIEKLAADASIIKLVNQIILEAYRKRATDIHIEPYRGGVALRYRIDGILYDANVGGQLKNFVNAIISRIKIMSNLNIVERRLPQDGRAVVKVQEHTLDLRISTIPTPFGESVVVRILPADMLFSLEKLGLSKKDFQVFENLILKPHGIIFVTGPTGSGKTTTLYACLSRINTKDRKIITIEDPIEYEMAGITQIQVMPDIGLDFARGLRSILRHDPDVIMVGEVRDFETAEIAIRVALTGHLVFSTLHTNDATSAVTRLLDIGVEPYLVASSVEALIAQRLIRVICPDCKYEDKNVAPELKKLIAFDLGLSSVSGVKVFRGKGCNSCNFTGFFGRTAIYEILLVDESIRDLVLKKAPSSQIKKTAMARGMRTLRQDGWHKVINGISTPEEVMKVTSSDGTEEKKAGALYQEYSPQDSTSAPALQQEEVLGMDRRIYSRLDRKLNLRFKVFKSGDKSAKSTLAQEQLSVTKDISAGGLLFLSSEPIAVDSVVELKVELPGDPRPIECLARVIRVDTLDEGSYHIAACFLDMAAADKALINKYIDSQL